MKFIDVEGEGGVGGGEREGLGGGEGGVGGGEGGVGGGEGGVGGGGGRFSLGVYVSR